MAGNLDLREWWNDPFDRGWLLSFFDSRSLTGAVRVLIALCAGVLGTVPALVLLSPTGPTGLPGRIALFVIAFGTYCWVARWLVGDWPTPATSFLFIIWSDVSITFCIAIDADALAGLAGSTSFVLAGAYVTFFHGPKTLACHLVWAFVSTVAAAIPLILGADPALAVAKLLVLLVANVAMPPLLQFSFWLIRSDAVDSLVDPLTGLLNRRGLHTRAPLLVDQDSAAAQAQLVMITIDLDHFKEVNDTLGHATGDEVLVRTALRIKSVVRGSAVLARLGGEEFVVMDVVPADVITELAERIQQAIGAPATHAPVTASVGVAAIPAREWLLSSSPPTEQLDALLDRADHAMYRAKNSGRNTVAIDTGTST